MQDGEEYFEKAKVTTFAISNREELEVKPLENPIVRSLRFLNYLNESDNTKEESKSNQNKLSDIKLVKINKNLVGSLERVNLMIEYLRNITTPLRYREEQFKLSTSHLGPNRAPINLQSNEQDPTNGQIVMQDTNLIFEQPNESLNTKKINFYKKKHYLMKARELLKNKNIQKRENTRSNHLIFKEIQKIKSLGFKINFTTEHHDYNLNNLNNKESNEGNNNDILAGGIKLTALYDKFSKYACLFSSEKAYNEKMSLVVEYDKSKDKDRIKDKNDNNNSYLQYIEPDTNINMQKLNSIMSHGALSIKSNYFHNYNKEFEISVEITYGEDTKDTICFGPTDMRNIIRNFLVKDADLYFGKIECEQYLKELSFFYYHSIVYFFFKICKIEINAVNSFFDSNIFQFNDITFNISQIGNNEYSISLNSYDFLQITIKLKKKSEIKESSSINSQKKEFMDFIFPHIHNDRDLKEEKIVEGQVTAMFIKRDSRLTNTANGVKKFYKKYIEKFFCNVIEKMKYSNNIKNFMKNVKNNENKLVKNPKLIENYFSNIDDLEDFDFDLLFENNLNLNSNFNMAESKKNFLNSTLILSNLMQLQRFILRKIAVVSVNKKIESFENFDCSNSLILCNNQSLVYEHTYNLDRVFNHANDQIIVKNLQFSLIFCNDKIRIEFLEEFITKLYFCENGTFTEKTFDFMNFNYLLKHLNNYLNTA